MTKATHSPHEPFKPLEAHSGQPRIWVNPLRRRRGAPPSSPEPAANADGTSLRRQLLLTVLPVILLPLVMASAVGYRIVAQRSEKSVQEQLENQALLTSEGATAVLEDLLDLPRTIAASPLVVNEALAGSQKAVTEGLPDLPIEELEKRYGDTKLLRQHQRLNAYLKETIATAEISEISVTESHGFNVAYSEPTTDFVQNDESWWQAGKEQGAWIGAPDFDYAAKGYTVELAQAIHDPTTGDFVGVIRAVLPTRKFSLLAQYVKRTGISGSQQVQLIDGAALKVIDSFSPEGFQKSRDIVGGKPVEELIRTFVTAKQPPVEARKVLQALQEQNLVTQLTMTSPDETTMLVSFTHGDRQYKLASIPNTDWVAMSSMAQTDIAAAGRDSLLFLGLTTVLLASVTSVLFLWLARQLSDPLSILANQAELMAAGDFNTWVEPQGTKETRTLTQSFNQLVGQIKAALQTQAVETRKAQLFAVITGTTASSLADLKPILDQILPEARSLFKADRALFYPANLELSELLAAEDLAPGLTSGLAYSPPAHIIPESLLAADPDALPLIIEQVETADISAEHRAYLNHLNVRSTLTMPMFAEAELFGFLVIQTHQSRTWEPAEEAFIAQLAGQLELVINRITALKTIQETRAVTATLAGENQQQSLTLNQHKEQLAYQSEMLMRQNEELRRYQDEQQQQKEQLQQQIAQLVEDMQSLLQGDLTVQAQDTEGALKTATDVFNSIVSRLQALVSHVQRSSTQLHTILTQQAAIASQLTTASLSQAQKATKALEMVHPMSEAMRAIAENGHMAAATAKTVATTAASSETGLKLASEQFLPLSDACSQAFEQLQALRQTSQPLEKVTALIRETAMAICLQLDHVSNPLSSPEDQDRFKTIAQDITMLANQTLEETVQIEAFLKTFQQAATQATAAIGQVGTQVTETTQLVRGSHQDLENVATMARQVDQLSQSIATATRTQSNVSRTVSKLTHAMTELSEQTVPCSQSVETSLHETVAIAQDLQQSVKSFKVAQGADSSANQG
jgi:methyl-accepting chemotaxis protein PixJ